jgi:hypothetical protein
MGGGCVARPILIAMFRHTARLTIDVAPRGVALARRILRDARRERRAVMAMPKPVPWDWAQPRLVPLLAGPCIDLPDCAPVRGVSELGPALVFGVDIGRVYPLVDVEVAERWEASADQIQAAAMANFRARAARTASACVAHGTMSGWITTFVRTPAGLASSLVLAPDDLRRLIGAHDQVIATPTRELLIAMPSGVAARTFADVVVDLERSEPLPLCLDPFAMVDGDLSWGGCVEGDADEEDRWLAADG